MFAGNIGGGDEAKDEGEAGSYRTNGEYRGASKKEKRVLLDQFVRTTRYSRWYARFVLRHEGRRIQADKQTIVLAVRSRSGTQNQKASAAVR